MTKGFAELLKPFKDLTTNWELPLADLLSTYIDDLQHLTITFDGGETSVNFAEAALLLQGTANVYSKKVEFLWQMVLKTLEMLRSKKEEEEEAGTGDGDGQTQKGRKKNQVDMTREFGLLEADLGKNIDVKNDEDESLTERKNALNFIYITPRQLIEKEGSEQKSVKVNLFMGVQSGKFDILAAKEDFRINSQYVSVTGGLGEDLTVDNRYLSVSMDDYEENTMIYEDAAEPPAPLSPHSHLPISEEAVPPSPQQDSDGGDISIADISNTSIRVAGQHNGSQEGGEFVASLPPPTPPACREATPEPVFDPWAPLDPYEVLSTPKPLKKGKTIRLPPSLRENQSKKTKVLPPIEQYLVQEMTNSLYNPSMLQNVPPVFYDLASTEIRRRRQLEKEERMNGLAKNPSAKREVLFEPDEEDNGPNIRGEQIERLTDNDDELGAQELYDEEPGNFSDDDLPNPHLGGDMGSFVMEDFGPVHDHNKEGDSYEDLVAKRVAEFVQKSQDFLKSSELTLRVAKWHDMIGPRLDKVEQRKAFDVHAYGTHVLNSFNDTLGKNSENNPVDFVDVVSGKRAEEVARYFLSTLMLANTENVKIGTKIGTDPMLGM